MIFDDAVRTSAVMGRQVAVVGSSRDVESAAAALRLAGVDVRVGVGQPGSDAPAPQWQVSDTGLAVGHVVDACEDADVIVIVGGGAAEAAAWWTLMAEHTVAGDVIVVTQPELMVVCPAELADRVGLVMPCASWAATLIACERGQGVPVAVAGAGEAGELAVAIARALGAGRAGLLQTSAEELARVRLVVAHACGGALIALAESAHSELVSAGCDPDVVHWAVSQELTKVAASLAGGDVAGLADAHADGGVALLTGAERLSHVHGAALGQIVQEAVAGSLLAYLQQVTPAQRTQLVADRQAKAFARAGQSAAELGLVPGAGVQR